ncbi:hypothetical protein ACFWZ2_38515 [Streptomyces sp. NPDC059002]|uniref:hypothetical protein n=1 Tax=Streptomyces sp. NPDC059002 TaxID=3346690 RepID=UPI003681B2B4
MGAAQKATIEFTHDNVTVKSDQPAAPATGTSPYRFSNGPGTDYHINWSREPGAFSKLSAPRCASGSDSVQTATYTYSVTEQPNGGCVTVGREVHCGVAEAKTEVTAAAVRK